MKLFFHCHKAAGTTVVHAAKASGMKLPDGHRNGNPVGADGTRVNWKGLSDEETLEIVGGLEAAGVDLFCVEFDFPRWKLLDRIEGLDCFTVLRDPAARAYSNFRMDLLNGKYNPEVVHDFRSFMNANGLFRSDNFYTRFFCRLGPKAPLAPEQVAFARARLERFAAVAVLEHGALASELAPLGFRPESFEWKNRALARPRHKMPGAELLAMGFDKYPDDPDYFAANACDYALYSYFLHRRASAPADEPVLPEGPRPEGP